MRLIGYRIVPKLLLLSLTSVVYCGVEDWLFPAPAARIYTTEQNGSYFGYSVASYQGQSKPFCLVGAPNARKDSDDLFGPPDSRKTASLIEQIHGKSTGSVYRLDLDPSFPDCDMMPIASNDDDRRQHGTLEPGVSLWIGGLVAATNSGRDGLQLGCDPRYLYTPSMSNNSLPGIGMQNMGTGTCALYTGVSMQYTPIDACVSMEEGTCLSGFSGAMEAGSEAGEAFVVLGMPGSYLTEGNVFFGHYKGRQTVASVRLKSSPQDLKHRGFNLGYAVGMHKRPSWRQKMSARFTILASSPMWIDNNYLGIVMVLTEALNVESIDFLRDQWGHVGSFFGYSLAIADLDGNGIPDIVVSAPYYSESKFFDSVHRPLSDEPERPLSDQPPEEFQADTADQRSDFKSIKPDVGRVYIFYGKRRSASPELDEFLEEEEDSEQVVYDREPPTILSGPKRPSGRFGHATVSLGDVDGDGIEDLAVSCPFCPDKHGRADVGAVFIYLGQNGTRIKDEPDQVIYPADLPHSVAVSCGAWSTEGLKRTPFTAFGWSLSAKADVDNNKTPDLVVGDFKSQQVVTLRSRNVLWMDSPQWTLPSRPTLDWSGPQNSPCGLRCRYNLQLTLHLQGRDALFQQEDRIRFRYRLDLDSKISERSKKRLQVVGGDGSSVLTGEVEVTLSGSNESRRLRLFDLTVEPKLRETREHLWKAVVVNASVELLPDNMPFLSTTGDGAESTAAWTLHPSRGQRVFLSRPMFFSNPVCGHDDICVPQLDIEVYDSSVASENPSIIYYRERVAERNLTVAVRNLGENAYDAKLRLKVPRQFGYVAGNGLGCKVEGDVEGTEEDPNSTITTVVCNLPNPFAFANSQWDKFVFQLSTSGVFQPLVGTKSNLAVGSVAHGISKQASAKRTDADEVEALWQPPESLTVTAEITSDNENLNAEEVKAHFTYDLQLFANVEISSSSVDRTIIDTRNFSSQFIERQRVHPESLGPEVKHIFLVSNSGPSPMENIWVNLSVPVQTQEGDFLVYLLDVIRSVGPSGGSPLRIPVLPEVISAEGQQRGTCFTPDWAINMLRLNAVDRSPVTSNLHYGRASRSKRDTQVAYESYDPLYRPEYPEDDVRGMDQSQLPARAAIGPRVASDRGRQLNVIECNRPLGALGVPVCVEIPCRIDKLGRGDAVRIVMRGWVWADTLFRHKFSDVAVVTTATPILPSRAFGLPVSGNFSIAPLTISQNLVFEGIKRLITQPFPLIPVIIGVVLGLILLVFIVILMWWCGFFKRAKKPGSELEDETIQKPAQL
ncbi:hypothetical protein AAHC03_09430 [Spirometra sp. Aus1]